MDIGIAAALGSALAWALSATFLASQSGRVDTMTIAVVRAVAGSGVYVAALFVLGGDQDIARMSTGNLVELIAIGVLAVVVAETLYVGAIGTLGMTRAFTVVVGLYILMAYAGAAIFQGAAVSWQVGAGSAIVLGGVYLVAIYGRVRPAAAPEGPSPAGPRWAWTRPTRRRASGRAPDSGYPPIAGGSGINPAVAMPIRGARLPFVGQLSARQEIGLALAVAAAVAWGAATVWMRSAGEGIDATAVGVVRAPAVLLLLGVAALSERDSCLRRRALSRRSIGTLLVSGVVGGFAGSILFFVALQRIGAGETTTLWATGPLFGLPLGVIFLRERVTRWGVLGAALVLAGIAILA